MTPGRRLRSFARRICSADTIARVVDPLIADLQFEYAKAIDAGHGWRARRIRLAGYLGFWKTVALCGGRAVTRWATDHDHLIGRTIGFGFAATVALTAVFALIPLSRYSTRSGMNAGLLFLYLVPQALSVSLPFGLMLGLTLAIRGRLVNRRIFWSVIGIAMVCTVLNLMVCGWVVPEANQAFRVLVSGRASIAKGVNELTFGELIAGLNGAPSRFSLQTLSLGLHGRLAISFAPPILSLFAVVLSTVTRRTLVSSIIVVLVLIVYVGYGAVVVIGPALSGGWPPLWAFIWFPNIFVAGLTGILFICSDRSRFDSGSGTAL